MKNDYIVRKTYYSFVLVSILSSLTATAGMLIDNVIVGRYLGSEALGAMGIIGPVSLVFSAIGNICSGGGGDVLGGLPPADGRMGRQAVAADGGAAPFVGGGLPVCLLYLLPGEAASVAGPGDRWIWDSMKECRRHSFFAASHFIWPRVPLGLI